MMAELPGKRMVVLGRWLKFCVGKSILIEAAAGDATGEPPSPGHIQVETRQGAGSEVQMGSIFA